jgi:predicted nuclease of restriction endonuclease-like RecB superfamily
MPQPKKTPRKKQQQSFKRGLKHGYRSGLEDKIAQQIHEAGLPVIYEQERVDYIVPARPSKYTPDFKLPKQGGFFYVETKGRWVTADRQKHLLLKKQHPDIDIRFVFSNQNAKLYKGSPTTYAAYCEKHGFKYAHKVIPEEWLHEGD